MQVSADLIRDTYNRVLATSATPLELPAIARIVAARLGISQRAAFDHCRQIHGA